MAFQNSQIKMVANLNMNILESVLLNARLQANVQDASLRFEAKFSKEKKLKGYHKISDNLRQENQSFQ